MVVGLILVSTAVAASCAGLMLLLGGGWFSVIGIYISAGMVTTLMILLRLILTEMHNVEDGSDHREDLPVDGEGRPAKPV